jgi:two-component system, OmpR family, KDP operon response regulator KdpE
MTEAGSLVLIIEDEAQMRRMLRVSLVNQGYRLVESATGSDGLVQAASRAPDLVLLDLGLPDMDGLEVTRRLREWSKVPIVILSARGQEEDKIKALDGGADDYLTKPFSVGELLARMRVALRHSTWAVDSIFSLGDVRVDFGKRQVTVAENEIHLTPIEYKLLTALIKSAGKVVTHQQLLREVWGPNAEKHTQYLRVYMGQLRQKLERDPARPELLVTEPGVGYRLFDHK